MFKKECGNELMRELAGITGEDNIFTGDLETTLYSYDASMARAKPCGVIRFTDTEQISPVVKLLCKKGISFSPRSAGTNLSGGTVNLKGGFILNMAALDKIHQIDTENNFAVVEPGVVNLDLQEELAKFGFFYAPDPASQKVSTIGGNIAENAGGPQCLKYGVTSDNLLKLELVLPDGSEKTFSLKDKGFELLSLFPQSEGTLCLIKKAWLKILPLPKNVKTVSAAFPSIEASIKAVTEIIAAGVTPRALEAMDRLSIEASGEQANKQISKETQALLITELDSGGGANFKKDLSTVLGILNNNGSLKTETASDEKEKETLWKIRKESYPALARISPNVMVEDGAVPRPKLPQALKEIREILNSYKIRAGLVFHAGDGNLHPNMIFDERDLEETRRVRKAGNEILKICIKLGGTISGEHGIGVEKRAAMNWLYNQETLELFRKIKNSFDPEGLLNSDKKIPVSKNQIAKIEREEPQISGNAHRLINEIKFRNASGGKTAITGSNSKKLPVPADFKPLRTETLTSILDLDRENFTVTVEAGTKIKDFKKILSTEDMGIDIPDFVSGTVGGMLASKEFIALRSLVTGMDLALPNGDFIRLGGKTMKDVSGYDLIKMLLGSYGTLALILNATFKLKKPGPCFFEKFDNSPEFGETHLKIKRVFDPANLFNPWMTVNIEDGTKKDEESFEGGRAK